MCRTGNAFGNNWVVLLKNMSAMLWIQVKWVVCRGRSKGLTEEILLSWRLKSPLVYCQGMKSRRCTFVTFNNLMIQICTEQTSFTHFLLLSIYSMQQLIQKCLHWTRSAAELPQSAPFHVSVGSEKSLTFGFFFWDRISNMMDADYATMIQSFLYLKLLLWFALKLRVARCCKL